MRKTIFTLTAGAVALAAGAAFAGHHEGKKEMTKEEKMAKMEAKLEEKFAKIDANSDGSISADEFMAYKTAEAEADWAKWTEGDADGAVTLEEAKAMQAKKMAEKKAKYEAKKKEKKDG
jgi:RNA exonuclease 4